MNILLCLALGILFLQCFFLGVIVGHRIGLSPPSAPVDTAPLSRKEAKIHRQQEAQRQIALSRLDTILHNVEAYDGTPAGQLDIPGGDGA